MIPAWRGRAGFPSGGPARGSRPRQWAGGRAGSATLTPPPWARPLALLRAFVSFRLVRLVPKVSAALWERRPGETLSPFRRTTTSTRSPCSPSHTETEFRFTRSLPKRCANFWSERKKQEPFHRRGGRFQNLALLHPVRSFASVATSRLVLVPCAWLRGRACEGQSLRRRETKRCNRANLCAPRYGANRRPRV